MKKMMFLVACLVAMATTASAQFMGGGASSSSKTFGGDSYSSIRLHYNNFEIEDCDAVPSFGVTFVKGWAISQEMPLFLEAGFGISYTSGDLEEPESEWEDAFEKGDNLYGRGYESTVSLISAEIPVNLGYKFEINDDFSIMPYVGVTARFNVTGKAEFKDWEKMPSVETFLEELIGCDCEDCYDDALESYEDYGYNADGYKEDTIEEDLKKLQFGWQIGATAMYKKFNIGFSYGADFNEIADECKAKSLKVSVGYNF